MGIPFDPKLIDTEKKLDFTRLPTSKSFNVVNGIVVIYTYYYVQSTQFRDCTASAAAPSHDALKRVNLYTYVKNISTKKKLVYN